MHDLSPHLTRCQELRIGPVLTGVIGRQSGTAPGFAYSALNKAAGENGLVWSNDLIDAISAGSQRVPEEIPDR